MSSLLQSSSVPPPTVPLKQFCEHLLAHRRWLVLTGAGCSTDSGIPDYRDGHGQWKRPPPIHLPEFRASAAARQRYWARSMVGWRYLGTATPNDVHHHLAQLERRGHIHQLITQNVDGLHQAAGSKKVIDLHGRLDEVVCLDCGMRMPRATLQAALETANPAWHWHTAAMAPDGDADLRQADYQRFQVEDCARCGGILKPDVVFFGENVPRPRVAQAMGCLAQSDALLVIGSSLMVFSGYRFARAAAAAEQPLFIINQGRTRADHLVHAKISMPAAAALGYLVSAAP